MKHENAGKLLRAMTDVRDRYVEEAEKFRKENPEKSGKNLRFPSILRFAAAVAAGLILLLGIRYIRHQSLSSENPSETARVNPYREVDTLEEATEITGFDMTVPEAKEPNGSLSYLVLDGEMIEVSYRSEETSDTGFYIRKAAGNKDISGDSTEYADSMIENVDGINVTLKGSDGKWSLATWSKDGYSYAIGTKDPMTKDEMLRMVKETR